MMFAGLTTAVSGMVERLNPRERVLLGVMALLAIGMVCFLLVLMTNRSLSALEEEVAEQATLLKQLNESSSKISERLPEAGPSAKQPGAEPPPPLGTWLQTCAIKAGMGEIDLEMTPQPEERVGDWIRKSFQVNLRRKPLGQLASFWAMTVNDRAEYPVAITKLKIRRRVNDEDAYDVEMIVSSYTPSSEPAPEKSTKRGGSKAKAKRSKSRP